MPGGMGEVLVELLGEVPGEVLRPGPATSQLPASAAASKIYPAQGLTGNRRQQGNLANGLPNYTYEVIWSFAPALICI